MTSFWPLRVTKTEMGFGLVAEEVIPRGAFIIEYVGELLTKKKAAVRHKLGFKVTTLYIHSQKRISFVVFFHFGFIELQRL